MGIGQLGVPPKPQKPTPLQNNIYIINKQLGITNKTIIEQPLKSH